MPDNDVWDWSGFWSETLNQFRNRITEQEWVMWFSNLEYISGNENTINISVPSSFYKDQISQRYGKELGQTIEEICGNELSIVFEVVKKSKDTQESRNTT